MKKLKCGNESTYEIYNDTVCCPSGNANVRSYFEIWMPEDVMEFSEFEALVRDKEAMQKLTVMTDKGAEEAVFLNYTLPVEISKRLVETFNPDTMEAGSETRLFARMEQPTCIEQKLAELGLM